MLMQMHKQCEFFQHSVNYNPRDDQAFASWGSMLMHLSMVCEQQVKITFFTITFQYSMMRAKNTVV